MKRPITAVVLLALGSLVAGVGTGTAGAGSVTGDGPSTKITAGQVAEPGAYPFTVSVGFRSTGDTPYDRHGCGGSVIRAQWVLTAAHCTEGATASDIVVTAGTHDLSSGSGQQIAVVQIVDHPQYDPDHPTLANDISLLRLAQSTTAPAIRLVQPGQEALWSPGTVATLMGWGGISPDEEDQEYPALQHVARFPIISDQQCATELEDSFDASVHVCAGAPAAQGGPDACRGDSGGPLVVRDGSNWVQVGIVSFGETCGMTYTAYTRVASYGSFITSTVGPDASAPFSDIAGNVHETAIRWAAETGVAGGFSDGTYRPNAPVTRGQMATFLVRALDVPAGPSAGFADTAGSTHAAAIDAVAAAGIAGGFPDGTYRPNAPVTRGQMATFLTRALRLPAGPSGSFSDVSGNVHEAAIDSVAAMAIAGGFPDGTFRPNAPVNRGQMATFLHRATQAG